MGIIKFKILDDKLIELESKLVLLVKDVAELFQIETKRINEAVKNNSAKFPNKTYMIELSNDEWKNLKSNFSTSSWGGTRKPPKAFTEKGLYMVATILKSKNALNTTFQIIETFAKIKELSSNINNIMKLQMKLYKKS
jgi:hypothetical protein